MRSQSGNQRFVLVPRFAFITFLAVTLFTMTGMPVASSQYWNMVYGGSAEEVKKDAEGLQTMRTLGRNMAFLMKSIQIGKQQIGLPEKEPAVFTNFHH